MERDEWLDSRLSPEQAGVLRDLRVVVSPEREADLYSLIVFWRRQIAKLRGDLSRPDSDRTVWGAHDYVAALFTRDAVAEGLDLVRLEPSTLAVVDVLDGEFMSCTEPDDTSLLTKVDDSVEPGSGWWWARIPVSGPARREIARTARGVPSWRITQSQPRLLDDPP
ncbi:hypothetical protein [Amycolatopsis plumensis]|uniref:Uncharacterized protein n=1 Tax=Amycolatopsis plumensis TaxID=236508 RepID=A0ABV5UJH9_9PSEU